MGRHKKKRQYSTPLSGKPSRWIAAGIAAGLAFVGVTVVTKHAPTLGITKMASVIECGERTKLTVDVAPGIAAAVMAQQDHLQTTTCFDLAIEERQPSDTLAQWRSRTPDVWIPDSELWRDRLVSTHPDQALNSSQPFAMTPILWAVPKQHINALGGTGTSVTWKSLLQTPLEPQFAQFNNSTASLVAMTQMRATLQNDEASAKDVGLQWRRAGIKLADTEQTMVTSLHSDKPRTFPLTEQQLSTLRSEEKHADLAAVLPSDPPQKLDYHAISVGTKPQARELRDAIVESFTSDEGQDVLHRNGFRSTITDVGPTNIGFGLHGNKLANIDRVTGAEADEAERGFAATTRGTEVLLVVDRSVSMSTKEGDLSRAQIAANACKMAMGILSDRNMLGYWEFATGLDGTKDYVTVVPTRGLGETVDGRVQRDIAASEFQQLPNRLSGQTGLYDTAVAAAESMGDEVPDRNRIILIVTDGHNDDNTGGLTQEQALQRIAVATQKSKTSLNFISMGEMPDLASMTQMAEAGGGRAVYVDNPNNLFNVMSGAFLRVL